MGQSRDLLLVAGGPTAHWIRPEMLVDLTIEGRNVNALADGGSQVNTITPAFIEPCRVRWKRHKSTRVQYPAHAGKGDHWV